MSGDVETNPGPSSNESSIAASIDDLHSAIKQKFSVVHLNVQSIQNKIDVIQAELSHFDVIALTETWLNDTVSNSDLMLSNFHSPQRKDRTSTHMEVLLFTQKILYQLSEDTI